MFLGCIAASRSDRSTNGVNVKCQKIPLDLGQVRISRRLF